MVDGDVTLGAVYDSSGPCRFRVWAPQADTVAVHVVFPQDRMIPLSKDRRGYHGAQCDGLEPGTRYYYRLQATTERPDPASRFQPEGVHGPSELVDSRFTWQDRHWHGLPLDRYVLYELHVGTYTTQGTFEAVVEHLDDLQALGITALELMPAAQFPGSRNWGYDGVYPFAVQNSYGGPSGLKHLVNACHQKGLAVVLDVVYNHLGPEGNYFADFGPYFSQHYHTPWGAPLNFDGPESDEVRRYFIENALYWISEFHIDALRLDAVHAILDFSARPFLQQLAETVQAKADQLNRRIYLIAESALNDTRLIQPRELDGFGLDAQWSDDFHHALHARLTGEKAGYYMDFGRLDQLSKAFCEGFVYSGQYSAFRRRRHGNSSRRIPAQRFVVCAQNHDQVGNRLKGERLSALVPFEALKLSAGLVLLSPFIPLLFMGEEYGETAPFPYFVSHSDESLIEAVREGRRREFAAFHWSEQPPDPQDEGTFMSAKLDHSLRTRRTRHRILFEFYRELLRLRRKQPALAHLSKEHLTVEASAHRQTLVVRRWTETDEVIVTSYFGDQPAAVPAAIPGGRWVKLLDSAEARWAGPGSRLPAELISDGEVTLELAPYALLLFGHRKETP
jgi:maltooligosyltrehalose trehalohydrolase